MTRWTEIVWFHFVLCCIVQMQDDKIRCAFVLNYFPMNERKRNKFILYFLLFRHLVVVAIVIFCSVLLYSILLRTLLFPHFFRKLLAQFEIHYHYHRHYHQRVIIFTKCKHKLLYCCVYLRLCVDVYIVQTENPWSNRISNGCHNAYS